jgi:non-specific serine/threonine protein kinase/serine/threonine-protein kinase
VRSRINNEVDTIVLKCLSKDRDRRYQNAGELTRDIHHYLAGEPIQAKRDSTWYALTKLVRRNRVRVAVIAAALLVLPIFSIWMTLQYRQARTAELATTAKSVELGEALAQAEQREKGIRQLADAQKRMLQDVDPRAMGAGLREDVAMEARAAWERSGVGAEEVAARVEQLESLLADANFTNVGVRSMTRNVLAPTLEAIEREYAGQPLVQAALWDSVGWRYARLALYDLALPAFERALEVREQELGDEHEDTLDSIWSLYYALRGQGKLAESDLYADRVLERLRAALERVRRERGADHPDTLDAIYGLTFVLMKGERRFSEAEPLICEGLDTSLRVRGDDHPETLKWMGAMGEVLLGSGRPFEAERYFRATLEGLRRVVGDDTAETRGALVYMGFVLNELDRPSEAKAYLEEWRESLRRVVGDNPSDEKTDLENLVRVLEAEGKLAEAETRARELLELYRRTHGDDFPATLALVNSLARLLLNQGKYADAEPFCRDALEGFRRIWGDVDTRPWMLAGIENNLGRSMYGLGRLDEADEYGDRAVRRARNGVAPGHWLIGSCLRYHAQTLLEMQRFKEAETELSEALEILAAAMGPAHPRTLDAGTAFAELYDTWDATDPDHGHAAKAAEWRAKLAEWQAATQPAPAP